MFPPEQTWSAGFIRSRCQFPYCPTSYWTVPANKREERWLMWIHPEFFFVCAFCQFVVRKLPQIVKESSHSGWVCAHTTAHLSASADECVRVWACQCICVCACEGALDRITKGRWAREFTERTESSSITIHLHIKSLVFFLFLYGFQFFCFFFLFDATSIQYFLRRRWHFQSKIQHKSSLSWRRNGNGSWHTLKVEGLVAAFFYQKKKRVFFSLFLQRLFLPGQDPSETWLESACRSDARADFARRRPSQNAFKATLKRTCRASCHMARTCFREQVGVQGAEGAPGRGVMFGIINRG